METKELFAPNQQFKDRNVSIKKAVQILAKNNIEVDEDEANGISDFLYLVAKSSMSEDKIRHSALSGNRTLKMGPKPAAVHENRLYLKIV